jgi:dihydroflavonol-4-reductase
VRTLTEGSPYDGTKATRDLGLVYTPIEASMRRTIGWYVEQGLIHRPLPGFSAAPGDESGRPVQIP